MFQCAAAILRSARRSATKASETPLMPEARIKARSHSIRVKSDERTRVVPERISRTRSPSASPSSHASTALDSAYRFNGLLAARRATVRSSLRAEGQAPWDKAQDRWAHQELRVAAWRAPVAQGARPSAGAAQPSGQISATASPRSVTSTTSPSRADLM